jgi:hypothetical protein
MRTQRTSFYELPHSHHYLHISCFVSAHCIARQRLERLKGAQRRNRGRGFKGPELVQPAEETIIHDVFEQVLNVANCMCKAQVAKTVHLVEGVTGVGARRVVRAGLFSFLPDDRIGLKVNNGRGDYQLTRHVLCCQFLFSAYRIRLKVNKDCGNQK